MPDVLQYYWQDNKLPNIDTRIFTATNPGSGWTPPALFYDLLANPPGGGITAVLNTQTGRPTNVGAMITFNNPREDIWRLPVGGLANPIEVDSTHHPAMTFPGPCGPFLFGGAQWTFGITSTTTRVYKSTDGGLTWAEQDVVHEPSQPGDAVTNWNGISNRMQCAQINGSNHPELVEFDFSTGLWTTAHDQNTANTAGNLTGVVYLSNGDVIIFYLSGGNLTIDVLSGGVWSTGITIGPAVKFDYAIVDASDRTHIVWHTIGGVGQQIEFYRNRSLGGVLSASHNFPDVFHGVSSFGSAVIRDGVELVLPYKDSASLSGNFNPGVWRGSPLNAPVWTNELVTSSAAFTDADLPFLGLGAASPCPPCPAGWKSYIS